jgi:hypothetical protein
MTSRIEESEPQSRHAETDPVTVAEEAAERALARAMLKSLLIAVPVMIAFWVILVAVAVRQEDPDWGSWLGMGAAIGVLAGVFFGTWMGFVAKTHALDDIDQRANRLLPASAPSHPKSAPLSRASDLIPEWPQDAGVAPPVHQRIEDIEGERLLDNEARARLHEDGFTDAQILPWVEAYFAERHEGDVEELVNWIRERERTTPRPDLETDTQ